MKKRNFYQSLRNAFFKNALMPILILVILWGVGTLVYNLLVVQRITHNANKEIAAVFNRQYGVYQQMLVDASSNQVLLAAAKEHSNLEQANEMLYQFVLGQNIGSIFYLFDRNGMLIASNTWSGRVNHQLNPDYSISRHFDRFFAGEIRESRGDVIGKRLFRNTQGHRDCVYAMAAPIYDGENFAGYLVFEWLQADVMKYIDTRHINYLVITDEYYYAIVSSDNRILSPLSKFRPLEQVSGIIKINDADMYMVSSRGMGMPFVFFTVTTLKTTQQMLVYGILFILVTAVLLIVIMNQLSEKMAQKNTAHLDELICAVDAMKGGDFSYQIKENGSHDNDEFEYLSTQYRLLLNQISGLLELNQRLSDMKRIAEIKQLQAQFHPHLIFNVLGNIKFMIYIKPEKAERMISLLANLLRYSIRSGNETVTVGQDIEYIKAYLELQKERYDSRITYSIDIPTEMLELKMPKLILQPLVENCINHGYRQKDTLDIRLTGELADGRAILSVADDGDGIEPEQLIQIQETLADPDSDTINFGLLNSHRRLQLIYGPEYGLQVDSAVGEGTKVSAVIPGKE